MTRPYRRFLHHDPFPEQVIFAIGYLLTSQGIPYIYYGTEQEFDGGGDHDNYVRENMFGNLWGAFETAGHHFFDRGDKIYKQISKVAKTRQQEPALRYGRQYFRKTSSNGVFLLIPIQGNA
jgi:glycosidase